MCVYIIVTNQHCVVCTDAIGDPDKPETVVSSSDRWKFASTGLGSLILGVLIGVALTVVIACVMNRSRQNRDMSR